MLLNDLWHPTFQHIEGTLAGRAVVLESEGQVSGYALLTSFWSNEFGGEVCLVDELYVKPAARSQGHGTELPRGLMGENSLWPEQTVALALEVRPDNHRDTGSDPLAVCRRLLEGVTYDPITATGCGRKLFQEHWPGAETITEIKAVARGGRSLVPTCRTLVDIGGQDTKAISLDPGGKVQKFVMNDRCAAGTGQFLEMMATALAYTRDEFVAAAERASRGESLSSLCSVFAQSEVVSLIARGAPKEEIALGVHQAIANRTKALAGGVPLEGTILFTGGCARNPCLCRLLEKALGVALQVPPEPQTIAALGCALGESPKSGHTAEIST